jgi:hypothetical protein
LAETFGGYPKYWTDFENLSYKTSIYNTVSVDLNSQEALAMLQKFSKTLKTAEIVRIERIQNLVAFSKYKKEVKLMKQKYQDEEIEIEKYKFHGTRDTDPFKLIQSEEGFDMRFSRAGMWGAGIYFAENANYSDKYSYDLDLAKGLKQLIIARILVGKAYNSSSDRSLKIPPMNKETKQRYDSVKGNTGDSDVYIIYDNGRCYPEYLVTYKFLKIATFGQHPFNPFSKKT